ncbi:MAG: BamA/TamA family outer membrane protein [Bacteroidetes bacterium]|nr:BamA/TamA family outer membrane protein [Bacteroidota bacterium]
MKPPIRSTARARAAVILLSLSLLSTVSTAQEQPLRTVVPGERYAAGSMHRLFFGDLWRDLWTTPINVPVLDLEHFAGGLSPVRRGGGNQTASLRMKGADGKEYKFRSLDKDPSVELEPKLRETFVADVLQDLISTANPYGAMVAVPILTASGTLNVQPSLYILPDSPLLGAFREEFAGMLGMIEVHPDEWDDDRNGFRGSDKVIGTYSLFEKLQKDTEDRVDAIAYLKARILDIFIGDWDRHTDQWRWARFEEEGLDWWQPIPRDRDQAFSRFDGLVPWISTILIPQLESCDDSYPGLKYLTWSGRHLDRRFLSNLPWSVFDSLAHDIRSVLTDEVLVDAVGRLPAEVPEAGAVGLLVTLKSRRDALPAAVRDYYAVLATEVDMHCSDEDELVEITRRADGSVDVFARTLGISGRPPIFRRTFHGDETNEIRIYLEGGDDIAVVRGIVNESIIVRVIGGKGRDRFVDSSLVQEPFCGFLPIVRTSAARTFFYDHGDESTFSINSSTTVDRTHMPDQESDEMRYEPPQRDWGWELLPGIMGAYNADLGILFGGGPIYTRYGFRDAPYSSKMTFMFGFAPMELLGKAEFHGDFRSVLKGNSLHVHAGASNFEVLNFFGFGNETENFEEDGLEAAVRQTQFFLTPSLHIPLSEKLTLEAGVALRHVRNDMDDTTSNLSRTRPYGSEATNIAHVEIGLHFDTRDRAAWPSSGVYAHIAGKHVPALFELFSRFETVRADLRTYFSADLLTDWTLALRAGGQYNHGKYPFFESAFLGGIGSARGFDMNRFAGDAVAYLGGEWRAFLTEVRLFVPSDLGLLIFAETGRVFLEDEESERWHPSWGGGFWLAPVARDYTFSATLGMSDETYRIDVAAGFAF